MKTKILYVLVSSEADVYLEQALVSAYSARRHNPDAVLTLLSDTDTLRSLPQRSPLLDSLYQEKVPVDFGADVPPMTRSRLLKTGMRNYVDGDFLYIDADTLISGSLAEADTLEADLAACLDLHSPFPSHPHYQPTVNMCRRLGFDVSGEPSYFNSGVMLVRDTPGNHAFFTLWQENYRKSARAGIRPDQPSLAQTDAALGHPVQVLSPEWNCQVQSGVRYLKDAKVFHYMCTYLSPEAGGQLYCLNDRKLLLRIRKKGLEEVMPVVEDPMKGFAPVVRVTCGEDLSFFQTRRYRWLRGRYRKGKFSLMEWMLKVKDHLLGKV